MQLSPRCYIILYNSVATLYEICDDGQYLIIDNPCSFDEIPYLILCEIVIITIIFIIAIIGADTFHVVSNVLDQLLSIMVFMVTINSQTSGTDQSSMLTFFIDA